MKPVVPDLRFCFSRCFICAELITRKGSRDKMSLCQRLLNSVGQVTH